MTNEPNQAPVPSNPGSAPMPTKFPAGPFGFDPHTEWNPATQSRFVEELATIPDRVEQAIEGLSPEQLDLKYNNWTVRQIVHHIADSHLNGYVRTKWALTEASPLIKAYNESAWSALVDANELELDSSLLILNGVHSRWSQLLSRLTGEEMHRTYFHPEMAREVRLVESVANYIWHAAHHTAQIHWVREHRIDSPMGSN